MSQTFNTTTDPIPGYLLRHMDDGFIDAAPSEIERVAATANLNKREIADIVGVTYATATGSRSVKRWFKSKFPYAPWRVLLVSTGLIDEKEVSLYDFSDNDYGDRPCLLSFTDPDFEAPSDEDIGDLFSLLKENGLHRKDIALICGVAYYESNKSSPTVKNWSRPSDDPKSVAIPYASWRLLMIETSLAKNICYQK